jgi:tight adherence protein C
MLLLVLYFVLAIVTIAALLWSGFELFRPREDPLAERLENLQASAMATSSIKSRRRGGGGFFNNVLYVVSLIPGGEGWLGDAEDELSHAGFSRKALAIYTLFQIAFAIGMISLMWWINSNGSGSSRMVGIFAGILIAYLIPQQVLHYLVRRYRQKLRDALPDTVDLLGIVLGTGLALDQAMFRVSEEMRFIYPELASEFATVVMQVRAGQERAKAFDQFTKRTGIEDIKSLAAMIIQSERFGTSLSNALKVYADSLRNRRKLRAEAAIAKAGVKMLFPTVLFILPALFIMALAPGLLSALQSLRQGVGAR